MMKPTVSIICPIFNEERFIEACVNDMLLQDYPQEQVEILLIDGMSTDKTRELLQPLIAQHPQQIRLLDNPQRVQTYAINIGFREAQGEYIVRMDAHCKYAPNYVSTLIHALNTYPNAQNVGCCWWCCANSEHPSMREKAIVIANSHPLGVGNALYRINKITHPMRVKTVPFGCWRKSWIEKVGNFREDLERGEDYEFNTRTLRNGGKIYLLPQPVITYYVRDSVLMLMRMFYQYALYKPLANSYVGRPFTLRQLVPPLFLLFIAGGGVLSIFFAPIRWIYGIIMGLYFLLIFVVSIQKRNTWLPVCFIGMHLAYGAGYWMGLFAVLFHHKLVVKSSR